MERARFDRMLSSKEVGTLIQAMGTGIGREDFNVEKLRYHKVVIMTDADVDGAHIRTLLLTFFYRQMPEIIERGHLYIAQPPLYKVGRGKSEVYLKDNNALDAYLIDTGLGSMVLETEGGQRAGPDLRQLVEHARRMRSLMAYIPRRYDPAIVEALALAQALDPALTPEQRQAAANEAARWMDAADEEGRWSAHVGEEGGYRFERLWRGVTDHHRIDAAFLGSAEARKLHKLASEERESYAAASRLISQKAADQEAEQAEPDDVLASDEDAPDQENTPNRVPGRADDGGAAGTRVTRPSELLDAVLGIGKKGLAVQRYKGLGEMNAEQLWETTLDPENRALLQVEIEQADVADEIFTKLMGDVVEPRREFIQDNALDVANLDV